jgi:hypothetical protein
MQLCKVWIDDIREPPTVGWIVCRSSGVALQFVKDNILKIAGISFDHDLGGEDTTREVAASLEEEAHNRGESFNIVTAVHSSNGPGRMWLMRALKNCTKFIECQEYESED